MARVVFDNTTVYIVSLLGLIVITTIVQWNDPFCISEKIYCIHKEKNWKGETTFVAMSLLKLLFTRVVW